MSIDVVLTGGDCPVPISRSKELPPIPDLELAVADLLRQVPAGQVTTFGGLGTALGEVQAARWLAGDWPEICLRHGLPGHRVVLKDGRLPDFRGLDPLEQTRKLLAEGVAVSDGRVDVCLPGILHGEFQTVRPLDRLREFQVELQKELREELPNFEPELVGGVDVSYLSPREGVAAYALIEVSTGRLVGSVTHRAPVSFPYVPGFLSFRETPLYVELLAEARRQGLEAEAVLVDGNGALHQRQMGVAAHLGIIGGVRTIGVSKSLLCGKVGEPDAPNEIRKNALKSRKTAAEAPIVATANVELEGAVVARALWSSRSQKPLYISRGQGVTLAWSESLVKKLMRGHKLPEPTFWAHTLSGKAAREATSMM